MLRCAVAQGVVFRKNVAHKRMRSSIARAGVLLLAGALEWAPPESAGLQQFDALLSEVGRAGQVAVGSCTVELGGLLFEGQATAAVLRQREMS